MRGAFLCVKKKNLSFFSRDSGEPFSLSNGSCEMILFRNRQIEFASFVTLLQILLPQFVGYLKYLTVNYLFFVNGPKTGLFKFLWTFVAFTVRGQDCLRNDASFFVWKGTQMHCEQLWIPLWKKLILQESSFAAKRLENVESPTVFTGNYFYAHYRLAEFH